MSLEEPKEQGGAPGASDQELAVIVAAVDTSPGGSRVVEIAARLARRNYERAVLHIVHVFKSSWLGQHTVGGLHIDQLMDEGRRYLDHYVRMAQRQCSAKVMAHFAIGEPVDEIVRLTDGLSADLLVIGAQDTVGTIERLLVGTVTGNVVQRARCSVLVVRPQERPPRRDA
jgi:nucleotide-binding universal stress UspA family protein